MNIWKSRKITETAVYTFAIISFFGFGVFCVTSIGDNKGNPLPASYPIAGAATALLAFILCFYINYYYNKD